MSKVKPGKSYGSASEGKLPSKTVSNTMQESLKRPAPKSTKAR